MTAYFDKKAKHDMKRLTKDQVRELPLFVGLGLDHIKLVENEQDAVNAVAALKGLDCVGFDTESKPTFRKGEASSGPALIQIATEKEAYLFPTRFPSAINSAGLILADDTIKKVGFGLRGDKNSLRSRFGIKTVNTEDLSIKLKNYFGEKDRIGARAALAMMLHQRLGKGAQQSNWEAYPLKEYQLKYAANDAYAALCVEIELSDRSKKEDLRVYASSDGN